MGINGLIYILKIWSEIKSQIKIIFIFVMKVGRAKVRPTQLYAIFYLFACENMTWPLPQEISINTEHNTKRFCVHALVIPAYRVALSPFSSI